MVIGKPEKSGLVGKPKYYAAAVTITNIKATTGLLLKVLVTTASAGSVIIYDDNDGTDDQICDVDTGTLGSYEFNVGCDVGIRIVKTGTAKVTVTYQ